MTPLQKKTVDFIRLFIEQHGYPPTFREIGEHFGTTTGSVSLLLKRLEKRGYISKTPYTPNTIRVLKTYETEAAA